MGDISIIQYFLTMKYLLDKTVQATVSHSVDNPIEHLFQSPDASPMLTDLSGSATCPTPPSASVSRSLVTILPVKSPHHQHIDQ